MKARKGFVSNSSTSSFVLLGFDATGLFDIDDAEALSKRLDFDLTYGEEGGAPEGIDFIVGEFLAMISDEDYGIGPEKIDIFAAIGKVTEIKEKLGAETPILVWTGRMMS